jgi:hypothetical protein
MNVFRKNAKLPEPGATTEETALPPDKWLLIHDGSITHKAVHIVTGEVVASSSGCDADALKRFDELVADANVGGKVRGR